MLSNFRLVLLQHKKLFTTFFLVVFLPSVILAGISVIQKAEAPRPDLITIIDVSKTTAPHQEVSISTTVKNIGLAPSPASFCEVIIRNARPPRQVLKRFQESIRELSPDDAFTFSISVKPGLGLYEACAYADAKKSVDENDETNNSSCAMIEGK